MVQGLSQSVRTSFLTAGPVLDVALPVSFAAVPQVTGIIDLGSDRRRECVFTPTDFYDDLAQQSSYRYSGSRRGFGGEEVEVYERDDGELWFLVWNLSLGVVTIHIRREDDGIDAIDAVASGLIVDETPGGVPSVLPEPPLSRVSARREGFRERIAFFEADEGGNRFFRSLEVFRPSSLSVGAKREFNRDLSTGRVGLRAGAMGNLEISISAAPNLEEAHIILDQVIAGL